MEDFYAGKGIYSTNLQRYTSIYRFINFGINNQLIKAIVFNCLMKAFFKLICRDRNEINRLCSPID